MVNNFLNWVNKRNTQAFKQVMTVVMKTSLSLYYGCNELLSPQKHFHFQLNIHKEFALGCYLWFWSKDDGTCQHHVK